MYGLIHTALRDMVIEELGDHTWLEITEVSNVPSDSFLTMRSYDDEVTLALVSAASSVLKLPVADALEAFGLYWMTTFAPKEYGALLDHTGNDPIQFLENLDDLHDRISTAFTDFKPPSFRVAISSQNAATIKYVSNRKGLTPFVLGILKGLGQRFDNGIEITQIEPIACERGEQCNITISLENADG